MNFKERIAELENLETLKQDVLQGASKGAMLCFQTLKTCSVILKEISGAEPSIKDILDLYPKLVGCEIEASMRQLQDAMKHKSSQDPNDALAAQILLNRKKFNDVS